MTLRAKDGFSVMRNEINLLRSSISASSQSNIQITREDFNYWGGFGDSVLAGEPSIFFRTVFNPLAGTPTSGASTYFGAYTFTLGANTIGDDIAGALYGAIGRSPFRLNQYRTFEAAVGVASGTATAVPVMVTTLGFVSDVNAPRTSPGVFFELSSPGGLNGVGTEVTPTIRAVVVDNTLAVVFDSVIPNTFTGDMLVPDYDNDLIFTVYKIHLTSQSVTFYINGITVATFSNPFFALSWDYYPQIITRATCSSFTGEIKTGVDFVSLTSSVNRQ